MNIKQKLHTGFGLLFLVVLFFGGLSLFYIRVITNSNKVILKDNYATLGYVDEMRAILEENDPRLTAEAVKEFRAVLTKEQSNITETGEKEAVEALTSSFKALINPDTPDAVRLEARKKIFDHLRTIAKLNLVAVERKSRQSEKSIQNATIYLSGAAVITFVVLFSFVFNLAGFFEEPLHRLTLAMQEIGKNKNFHTRLDFDRNDEFGEVSARFNEMASSLSHWNQEVRRELASEKICLEILANDVAYPVVGLNESRKILFLNSEAKKIFDLPEGSSTGKSSIEALQGFNSGPVNIKGINYQLQVHNIISPPSEFPEFEGAETISTAGKISGKIYVFKRSSIG